MVDFADGALVTPEGVVILTVLGIGIPDRGEQLVPGCGVGVGLRDAVGGLPANQEQTLCGLISHHLSSILGPVRSLKLRLQVMNISRATLTTHELSC